MQIHKPSSTNISGLTGSGDVKMNLYIHPNVPLYIKPSPSKGDVIKKIKSANLCDANFSPLAELLFLLYLMHDKE